VLLGGAAVTAAAGVPAVVSTQADADTPATIPHLGPIRWGVNYTPSNAWWLIWSRWDSAQVHRDFEQIRSLGFDHVRIQMPWVMFQHSPTSVAPVPLHRVVTMVDIAHRFGLSVDVTVLTTWLSGKSFLPNWVHRRNYIREPDLVDALHVLYDQTTSALQGHPGILGVDLGNELLNGRVPGNTDAQFQTWAEGHLRIIDKHLPRALNTVSTFGSAVPQRGQLAATLGDATVVHAWEFRPGVDTGAQVIPDAVHTAEYLIEGYRAYHSGLQRPLWLQETGAPMIDAFGNPCIDPDRAPDFAESLLRNALSCADVDGVTWWCSHDIKHATLPGWLPESEYSLGLFDSSGRRKPVADRISALIAEQRSGGFPAPVPRTVAIVGDDRVTFDRLVADGEHPTFVLAELEHDTAHLRARGIETVVQPTLS
jgi:hypothetical protein